MNVFQLKLLRDAREASLDAITFVGGISREEFEESKLVRYAVNYALTIIGEALNAASDYGESRSLAESIPELRAIIATRHRIAHAYDEVNEDIVWSIVDAGLPRLITQIDALIATN